MTSYLALTPDQVGKAVGAVIKTRPAYTEILGFYAGVFDAQEDSKSRLQLKPLELTEEVRTAKASGKLPLVGIEEFIYDADESTSLFMALCHLAGDANPSLSAAADALVKAVETGTKPDELFSGLLAGDEALFENIASELEIDKPLLGFFTYNSLKPSLCACADQLATYLNSRDPWMQGYCPVCGSAPILSILEHGGQRALVCSFCWHQWSAKRVVCPYCDSSQNKDLHYLYSEEEKDCRADLCDNCKKYIKTIDSRKADRLIYPPLEHIATTHLDMKAQETGFEPGIRLFLQV